MKTWTWALLAGLAAAPAFADRDGDQREQALRAFFEGRTVTVYIDMPATSKGIDVQADAPALTRLALGKVNERNGQNGVAIREGTRVPITKVNVKDDVIELQLGGGGFNWFWDTSGTVSPSHVGKSRRELALERELREEKDAHERRKIERELDEERRARESDERRSREVANERNEIRREKDQRRALSEGSRFNLRFEKKVPASAATPEAVMDMLSPWVDFAGLPGAKVSKVAAPRGVGKVSDYDGDLRPGMTRAEVQELFGPPEEERASRDGDLHKSVATFSDRGHRVEVTFVNGVLVQYKVSGER
jgi:hypothetical protein